MRNIFRNSSNINKEDCFINKEYTTQTNYRLLKQLLLIENRKTSITITTQIYLQKIHSFVQKLL